MIAWDSTIGPSNGPTATTTPGLLEGFDEDIIDWCCGTADFIAGMEHKRIEAEWRQLWRRRAAQVKRGTIRRAGLIEGLTREARAFLAIKSGLR